MRSLRRADEILGESSEQEEIPWSLGRHTLNYERGAGFGRQGPSGCREGHL